MKICLLGSSGFIGRNLYEKLLEKQEVVATNFRLEEPEKMDAFFAKHSDFDLIIHAAGAVTGDANTMMDQNLWGTFLLSEKLKHQQKPFSLIFISTGAVYGSVSAFHKSLETDPLSPIDFYGLSKKSAEDILRLASKTYNFNLMVLRLPSVYGPLNIKGVISKMVARAQTAGEITIFGDGKETRSFIDVRDVVETVLALIQASWSGTMNITSDEIFTVGEIAKIIQKKFPAKLNYQAGNNLLKRMVLDNQQMKSVTGLDTKYLIREYISTLNV